MKYRILKKIILISLILMIASQFVQGKGAADRIVITGESIEGEMIVDDPIITPQLSMAMLEDFNFGEIEAMDDLNENYTLIRQYENDNGEFIDLDEVIYYPDPSGGRGYIHYIGQPNVFSGYENRWYNITIDGESAIHRLLYESDVRPYILAYQNSGDLNVLDSWSLEILATMQIAESETSISNLVTSADGRYISYQIDDDYFMIDLVMGSNCRVDDMPTWVRSTPTMPPPSALFDVNDFEVPVTSEMRVINFNVLQAYIHDTSQSGIFIVNRQTDAISDWRLTGFEIEQYVMGRFVIYGLDVEPDSDVVMLYAFDQYNDAILNRALLSADTSLINYQPLDLSLFDDGVMTCAE